MAFSELSTALMRHVENDDIDGAKRLLVGIDHHTRRLIVGKGQRNQAPLFVAVKRGNTAMVKFLIKECHANIEETGDHLGNKDDQVTPLWYAAIWDRHLKMVTTLKALGADINAVSKASEMTPVNYACSKEKTDRIKFLVRLGADIQKPDKHGQTCLMSLIKCCGSTTNCLELCQLLIDNGAQVNAQDSLGETALHHAVRGSRLKVVEFLLHHGSDPYHKSKLGEDALQLASLNGDESIVSLLWLRFNQSTSRRIESLHQLGSYSMISEDDIHTAYFYWRKAVKLQMRNPSVDSREIGPTPAFMPTMEVNTMEDLEALRRNRNMAYMYALKNLLRILGPDHPTTAQGFIDVANVYDEDGRHRRCFDVSKYALKLLHCASKMWLRDYLEALKLVCSSCKQAYRNSETTIEFHEIFEVLEMATSMFDHSNTLSAYEITDIMHNLVDLVTFIIKLEKKPREMLSFKRVLKRLVRIQKKSENDRTFLHLIARNLWVDFCVYHDTVKLLLECGADVNALDAQNNTILHYYVKALPKQKETKNVIDELLEHSAHVDIVNNDGIMAAEGLMANMLDYVSLKCLAARVIRDSQIPYVGLLPVSLASFVQMHGSCVKNP